MRAWNAQAMALLQRIEAGEKIPAVQLVELLFPVPERYCTAGVTLPWGGHSWLGLGLSVEPVEDTASDMPGITLALPAVSAAQISLALTQQVEGTTVRVYDALVNPDNNQVADAILAWAGALNMPGIEDGPRASINVLAEHRGVLAMRPKPSRYTDDEQQRLFPGDTCLRFDPGTDRAPVVWPSSSYYRR